MRSARWLLITTIIAIVGWPAVADAHWWYRRSCTGGCSPGGLAAVQVLGPYPDASSCQYAISTDSEWRDLLAQSGNFGTQTCVEGDTQPAADGSSLGNVRTPGPTQRYMIGFFAGNGWTSHDAATNSDTKAAFTLGFDANWAFGNARNQLVSTAAWEVSSIEAPMVQAKPLMFVRTTIGFVITPALGRSARFSVGADGGLRWGIACDGRCNAAAGFVGDIHAGFDFYGGDRNGTGFGFDVMLFAGGVDGGFEPPTVLLRISLIFRNKNEPW